MKAFPLLQAAVLAAGLVAHVAVAQVQTLRDPTRPPGTAIKAGPGVVTGELVLQSILISPERKAAVISGRLVTVGQSVGGYMLVAMAENVAVLRSGDKFRRLHLYPTVDMKRQKEIQGGTSGLPSEPDNGQ